MRIPRKRVAQVCGAVAALATFLPWQTTVGDNGAEPVLGTSVSEGQLVLVVGLVTVGLVQVGWRPAWIGAGLIAAITGRAILDSGADPASGLWIAAAAAVLAAVLLIWEMFANVTPGSDGQQPSRRGLSGPLGGRGR